MNIQCLSEDNLNYEIFSWLETLKKNEELEIKITNCPVLKETYDLEIRKVRKEKR